MLTACKWITSPTKWPKWETMSLAWQSSPTVALHSGLLKKLRLLIVGLVKWAPTIWKQTCNAQKTESFWHFMTTTSAVQQTLKTYTARVSRPKYGVHSIKSTTKWLMHRQTLRSKRIKLHLFLTTPNHTCTKNCWHWMPAHGSMMLLPNKAVQVSPHVAVYTNTSRPWLTWSTMQKAKSWTVKMVQVNVFIQSQRPETRTPTRKETNWSIHSAMSMMT